LFVSHRQRAEAKLAASRLSARGAKEALKSSKLRIGIALSGNQPSFWRMPLARALRKEGHEVAFVAGPVDEELPGVALLMLLERLVRRTSPAGPLETPNIVEAHGMDLIVGGGSEESGAAPALALLCDGAPCAVGVDGAILQGTAPLLQAVFKRSGQSARTVLASGRAAIENPNIFSLSHELVANRLAQIAIQAVRTIVCGEIHTADPAPGHAPANGSSSPLGFVLRISTQAVARRLTRLASGGERWRVAWRVASGDEVAETMVWPASAFRSLPDDGLRYYADPFVYAHEGRVFVFCEEFPFATGRGLLSVFEVDKGEVVSAPRPFLEQPHHLSYPMIFSRDGAIWMIPESSAAHRIELWRAEKFPYDWRPSAVLVDGVTASDATLLEHGGRLWLFATVSEPGASIWDTLHLWTSERLVGPWEPHPGNPVLIDASSARPAGIPFLHGGRWIRPAQDCSQIYGGGLAFCAIDRLDLMNFSQSTVARLGPPVGSKARGVHTLNRCANIEAIDLFGPPVAD
jgi:hypothetical protein